MSDNLQTWIEFKSNPTTKALYTHDATVIFVPTSAGARGPEQISLFFRHDDFNERNNHVKEKMHNRVKSGEKLIEEADWTITLHSGECLWLAPTVPHETLLGSTVTIPVVRSVVFDDGQILSVRIYWDQASVLQQLKVLSSRKGIPIRGIEQVEALRNPQTVKLNVWNENLAPVATTAPKREEQKIRSHLLPGRVFGGAEPEPEPQPTAPRRIGPEARNIFTYQPKEEKRNVAHNPKRYQSSIKFEETAEPTPSVKGIKQHSSFSLSGDGPVQEPVPSVRSSAPPPRNIFEFKPEEAKTIAFNPKKYESSFSFTAEPTAAETVTSPTPVDAQNQLSSLSLEEDKITLNDFQSNGSAAQVTDEPEFIQAEPEPVVEESSVEPKKPAVVPTPMFGQPQVEPQEESFSGRPRSARSNQSSFSIGGQLSPETTERSFSGRPRSGLSNQSSFSFGQQDTIERPASKPIARRDPNASSFSLIGGSAPAPEESVSGTGRRLFKQQENREPEVEKPRVRLVKVPGEPNRNIFG